MSCIIRSINLLLNESKVIDDTTATFMIYALYEHLFIVFGQDRETDVYYTWKLRLHSLNCISTICKIKKTLFRQYWY